MLKLYIARKNTGVSIAPDAKFPSMWRIRHGDRVSDMVNLTRAKDAAINWACPGGLRGMHAEWKHVQSRLVPSLVR